jgi:CRP-like cAMP-binding protein
MRIMLDRFKGETGRRLLIQSMSKQFIIEGDEAIAAALVNAADLIQFPKGAQLIHQGDTDNDLYFIIEGSFSIRINGKTIAQRDTGEDVGEMAVVDPQSMRSASVIALKDSVVAMVTEASFSEIASQHPRLWRALARQQGNRLRQLNELLGGK